MKEGKQRPYLFTEALSEEVNDAFKNFALEIMKDSYYHPRINH
ncbi:MAG: hypothetical protein PHY59_03580 [Methanobacterium sp.]|nr:hypothetical protein [Methanobacterium sp.]